MQERVDVKAYASDGSYYRLSAQLKMASDRTKVAISINVVGPQNIFNSTKNENFFVLNS